MHVVYICYFSVCENLVQNQVVSYLKELSKQGYNITLLTYEPKLRDQQFKLTLDEQISIFNEYNITLRFLQYHKHPTHLATLFDIISGFVFIFKLHKKVPIQLLHARSHIPMIIALLLKICISCKVIFDVRGLLADEYVDAGIWKKHSLTYYILKKIELIGFNCADILVVLTNKMQSYLISSFKINFSKIFVIPCCVSSTKLMSGNNKRKEIFASLVIDRLNVIYAGSVSGLYLTEEIINFFQVLVQIVPNSTLTILTTQKMHQYVYDIIKTKIRDQSMCTIIEASPKNVMYYMEKAHVGLSFRKPTFSQIAASPTKIPEYLMAGIPVISNQGIGDTDQILEKYKVGVTFDSFTRATYHNVVYHTIDLLRDPSLQVRCQTVAEKYFDLNSVGIKRYNSIYRKFR